MKSWVLKSPAYSFEGLPQVQSWLPIVFIKSGLGHMMAILFSIQICSRKLSNGPGNWVWCLSARTDHRFPRSKSLVSVSCLFPRSWTEPFIEDVLSSPSTASVVTKINGVDAATYVGNWIYQASLNQDADAAYNSMFFKKAFNASGIGDGYFSSGGRARYITRWPT